MRELTTHYSEFLLEQAARCRRLVADAHDTAIVNRLMELAAEYEERALAESADISPLKPGPVPRLVK